MNIRRKRPERSAIRPKNGFVKKITNEITKLIYEIFRFVRARLLRYILDIGYIAAKNKK